jgi:hypothetical protein
MTALLSGTQAVRTSGALVLAGAVLSGPVAMLVVARMSPQPAWTGVSAFRDHYHPVQRLLLIAITRGGGLGGSPMENPHGA